jgi:hypothetical protein
MYIVLDKDGNPRWPFEKAYEAAGWAFKKWPEQPAHDQRGGEHREGWSIVAIRPAD